MMGLIKRYVGYNGPINVTGTCYLYSTLLRSNFLHCLTVRSPFNFIEASVSIQRAATRYVLNKPDLKYS